MRRMKREVASGGDGGDCARPRRRPASTTSMNQVSWREASSLTETRTSESPTCLRGSRCVHYARRCACTYNYVHVVRVHMLLCIHSEYVLYGKSWDGVPNDFLIK